MPSHFCYIIENETRTKTYVGYTTTPLKRIRQHNGEIKGGAKYTSRNGTKWTYVAIVSSPLPLPHFDNHIALSLEWHMKPHGKNHILRTMEPVKGRIQLLAKALAREKFNTLPIWIHVFDEARIAAFKTALAHLENVEIVNNCD